MALTSSKVIMFGTDWKNIGCGTDTINHMVGSLLSSLGANIYVTVPYFNDMIPNKLIENAKSHNVNVIGCKRRQRRETPDKTWITKYPRQYFYDSIWSKMGEFTHIVGYVPDTCQAACNLKAEYLQAGKQCDLILIICDIPAMKLSDEQKNFLATANKIYSVGPTNFKICDVPNLKYHRMLLPLKSFVKYDKNESVTFQVEGDITLLTVWPPNADQDIKSMSESFQYGLNIVVKAFWKVCSYLYNNQDKYTRWVILGVPSGYEAAVHTFLCGSIGKDRVNLVLETELDNFTHYLSLATLYISPFIYEPFDMFCVQAILYSIPTLLYELSGLGEFLGRRNSAQKYAASDNKRKVITTCLVDCTSNESNDIECWYRAIASKISSSTVISQAFEDASSMKTELLDGTLVNDLWGDFLSAFSCSSESVVGSVDVCGNTELKTSKPQEYTTGSAEMEHINDGMQHMHVSGRGNAGTAHYQRKWNDVFNNIFLMELAKELGPTEYRSVGNSLNYSKAHLDRLHVDNFMSLQNAAYALLDNYRNGSRKYGTPEQIEEFAIAFENADLIHLACKIRGVERVTLASPPSLQQQPAEPNISFPTQESMPPGAVRATASHGHHSSQYGANYVSQCMPPQSEMYVNVKPWADEHSYRKITQSGDAYTMKEKPRGVAMIININETLGMNKRTGSEVDEDLMKNLFQQLGFHVMQRKNLSAQDIKITLEDITQMRNVDEETRKVLSYSDCFILFLMSHGQKGEIFGNDGEVVQVKELYNLFREDRCVFLRDKPKLFFIQACRGGLEDRGGTTESDDPKGTHYESDEEDSLAIPKPTMSNILVSYSSVEGYKSYRNTATGSWYVREIKDVFSEHACQLHILDLLTKVTGNVAVKMPLPQPQQFDPKNPKNLVTNPVYKQCPQTETTLLKQLFFFPGK